MQEAVFFIRNFRALCKYKANVAMGAMEGTVQEGSIPTWMEVVFVTTFFSQKFPKYFLQRFIWTLNNLIGEKKFYKNLEE